MSPVPTNEELDQMLENPQPYLDDAGFTEQVLKALPPRRSADRARTRVLVGSALAAAAVFALGPLRSLWGDSLVTLSSEAPRWPLVALALLSAAVLCATALSAVLREAEG